MEQSRQSERKFAETLGQLYKEGSHLFSYGYEFYGTSFYSGLKIFRMRVAGDIEVFKLGHYPAMKAGDLIVFFANDSIDVDLALGEHRLLASIVENSINLGRKKVNIGRIENRV